MPLRDNSGVIENRWTRLGPEEALTDAPAILDLADAEERAGELAGRAPDALGLFIAPDTERSAIKAWFDRAGLISVSFPAFTDGRGFSLGRAIRSLGYEGRLRASGPVIADQYAYLRACGFDEVEIPEALAARQPEALWKAAASRISQGYQRGYAGARPIPDERRL